MFNDNQHDNPFRFVISTFETDSNNFSPKVFDVLAKVDQYYILNSLHIFLTPIKG